MTIVDSHQHFWDPVTFRLPPPPPEAAVLGRAFLPDAGSTIRTLCISIRWWARSSTLERRSPTPRQISRFRLESGAALEWTLWMWCSTLLPMGSP